MDAVWVAVLGALLLGGLVALLTRESADGEERAQDVENRGRMPTAGTQAAGSAEAGRGSAAPRPPRPTGETHVHDGVLAVTPAGDQVCIAMAFAVGGGPAFRMYESEEGAYLRSVVRTSISLGMHDVDEQHVVETAQPEWLGRLWEPQTLFQLRFLTQYTRQGVHIESDGRVLRCWTKAEMDGSAPVPGLDLVRTLASKELHELELLEELPGARLVPGRGPWDDRTPPHLALERRGARVTLEPLPTPTGVGLRVWAAEERHWPAVRLSLPGSPLPGAMSAASTRSLAGKVGRATLEVGDERVSVLFEALPTEARVEAAVDLVTHLAVPEDAQRAFG